MRRNRRPLLPVLAAVLLPLAACGTSGGDSSPRPSDGAEAWSEGGQRGVWTLVYSGYGVASADVGKETGDHIRLGPTAAADHDITHGALAVHPEAPADVRLTGRVTTERQRREGTPNPWEVGWFLWRYTDPDHFYALALKPNGWELSKQDPAYPGRQRFLASGDTPTYAVGSTHEVEIVAVGDTTTVRVDGRALGTVTDTERPYRDGGVGLYTEDAVVDFADVRAEAAASMPTWAPPAVVGATGRGVGAGPATGTGTAPATTTPAPTATAPITTATGTATTPITTTPITTATTTGGQS